MSKNEKKARSFNFEELLGKTIKTAQERDLRTRTGRSNTEQNLKILYRTRINKILKIADRSASGPRGSCIPGLG